MDRFTTKTIVQVDFDASVSKALSGSCLKLILTATEACYVLFANATVTTGTGFYIPADTPVELDITQVSYISAIKETTAGKLTILELY